MVALVILSIGLGALLVATSQNIRAYQRLEAHMAENWVSLQTINLLKLGLTEVPDNQPSYTKTKIQNLKIYTKIEKKSTPLPYMKVIKISTRTQASGPYDQVNYTYLYANNE